MSNKRLIGAGAFCLTLLVQGCISNPFSFNSNTDVEVSSKPSGAEVYVMGELVGTTPVKISYQTLYPTVYDQNLQNLYGSVVLKKTGCEEYKQPVSSNNFELGLMAKLDCEIDRERARYQERYDDYRYRDERNDGLRERDINRIGVAPVIPVQENRMNSSLLPSMEERINRVNKLRKDGLISEEEYKAARKRILEQL